MNYILIMLSCISGVLIYFAYLKKILHIVQLEGYKNDQFFQWLGNNTKTTIVPSMLILIITSVPYIFYGISGAFGKYAGPAALLLFVISGLAFIYPNTKRKAKKPLVYTHRLIRLICANILIILLETYIFISILVNTSAVENILIVWFGFAVVLAPLNVVLANLFIAPVELYIRKRYIFLAKNKISEIKELIKIGITGSYGKTSTKFILGAILSEKFKVLVTPDSYNTTMGTTKVILETLDDSHEVFISEMGARNIGDIAEIADIVKPDFGIITSIGKQHLETFGSLENIISTKYELVRGLKPGGTSFFPADNQHCYELYKSTGGSKVLYAIDCHIKEADMFVEDIVLTPYGSTFYLVEKNGERTACKTKLLGKHNILNILGCAAIARHLGLNMEEIAKGIEKIDSIPHRLQLLPTQNGTIVIDDAFNSNPVGAKMALEVLGQFEGRKIIITPGMVELGDEEYQLNKEFGKNIARTADIAILVGKKRTAAIQEGLKEALFDHNSIFVVGSLDEASMLLSSMVRNKDVILFENDLPDNYDE